MLACSVMLYENQRSHGTPCQFPLSSISPTGYSSKPNSRRDKQLLSKHPIDCAFQEIATIYWLRISLSMGTCLTRWSKKRLLHEKMPPQWGQPTSFSCEWLRVCSFSLHILLALWEQPANTMNVSNKMVFMKPIVFTIKQNWGYNRVRGADAHIWYS